MFQFGRRFLLVSTMSSTQRLSVAWKMRRAAIAARELHRLLGRRETYELAPPAPLVALGQFCRSQVAVKMKVYFCRVVFKSD